MTGQQLDLFSWADAKPSNVVSVVPAIIRRVGLEVVYGIPRPQGGAKIILLSEEAA